MESQVKAALKALMMCKKKMKKETLLSHDDIKVMLQISAIKVAPGAVKETIRLPLPVSFRESEEVCLFVKDLQKGIRVDHEKSQRHWRELIEAAGVTCVSEVMPLRQVKAEYRMYEAKRKLCDAYDFFVTDVRIARLLPTLLGKHFIAKKKQPVPVNMEAPDLAREIGSALSATYLHLYNTGNSSAVQVGVCGQSESELLQNTTAVVDALRHRFPGGLTNVRSLHLKLGSSPAIPVFVSDVLAEDVPVPAARYQPGSRRGDVTGELSTLRADSDVTVTRHGDVIVTQKRPISDDEEPTDEEEVQEDPGNRRRKKLVKKKAGSGPAAGRGAGDAAAEAEDGADSEDAEDAELEAHERRFLDDLAA